MSRTQRISRRHGRSPLTIAAIAAVALAASACGASGAASTRSVPSTTTSSTTIYHASGKGSGRTASFKTPTHWTLRWYWNCGRRKSLTTVSVGSSVLYHDRGIGGGGSHQFRSAGRHMVTFKLLGSCSWSVTVLKSAAR